MATEKLSPGMQQYVDIKKQYPDAFLLFRMGDFYELFYEDAINVAQILEISLTSRNKKTEGDAALLRPDDEAGEDDDDLEDDAEGLEG